jgi:tetratricopeptide (TPR) repeat protein
MDGLEIAIELRGAHAPAAVSFQADIQEPETDGAAIVRRARFLLPLTAVPPGDYLAHATVKVRGEVVAERVRQVEIVDGRAPVVAGGPLPTAVPPAEIVRGELARKYIAWLLKQATGTAAVEAARHASEDRWEHVELALQRLAQDQGVVPQALRGLALFVREDYAAAAAALAKAAAAAPDSALTAFFLGWAREGAGDTRAAIGAWRNAAHLDSTLVSAHLALADAYLRLSQPALAIQALRAGLAAIPDSIELRERLARVEQLRLPPSPPSR